MVKQVRVIRNVACLGVVSVGALWLVRAYIAVNLSSLLVGMLTGICYGCFYWWRLSRRVTRRNRRFARNKIFVQFLSVFELMLVAAVSSQYVLIALFLFLFVAIVLGIFSDHWWTVLLSSFGAAASVSLGANVIRYELRHGPLHYQYDARTWLGGEALLYQSGQVVDSLTPTGRITVNGELWNAVSFSGEAIDPGEPVEVIARKGLTLYVDRVASETEGSNRRA